MTDPLKEPVIYFDETSTPDWWHEVGPMPQVKPSITRTGHFQMLPPLMMGEFALNQRQIFALFAALKDSHTAKAHPLVVAVREHVPQPVLRDWFRDLMPIAGYLSQTAVKSAITGIIRHLLDADSLLALKADFTDWFKSRRTKHALVRLVLNAFESRHDRAAVQVVLQMADHLRKRRFLAEVQAVLAAYAAQQGISPAVVIPSLVPDGGFDARGERILDYGRRQFRLRLDDELSVIVYDDSGKTRKTVPKPGKRDDAAVAEPAYETWKAIKKQLRETPQQMADYLQQLMIDGTTITGAEMRSVFMAHPLLQRLIQRVIWGYYVDGQLQQACHVGSDLTLMTLHDEMLLLDETVELRVAHPLDLSPEERQAWQGHLLDFEIIPLFDQMMRPVHTLNPAEVVAAVQHPGGQNMLYLNQRRVKSKVMAAGWEPFIWGGHYQRHFLKDDISALLVIHAINNIAGHLAAMGAYVGAMTPGELADFVAEAIR